MESFQVIKQSNSYN